MHIGVQKAFFDIVKSSVGVEDQGDGGKDQGQAGKKR